MSYCTVISAMSDEKKALHQIYHDLYYGFPIDDDNELFCRLVLEINQAGLSWDIILKKQDNFRKAYANFDINVVATFGESDINRLLNDSGIIRNKLKISAAIANAKTIILLQQEFGSFQQYLAFHHPKNKDEWVKLFKKTFKFTGGEIVNEFLMSIGYLQGAHDEDCKIHQAILKAKPMWAENL